MVSGALARLKIEAKLLIRVEMRSLAAAAENSQDNEQVRLKRSTIRHMKRTLAALLLLSSLPLGAQTLYAVRHRGAGVGVPADRMDDIVLVNPGSEWPAVTAVMNLPEGSSLAAFDAPGLRMYIRQKGETNLFIADLRARTLSETKIHAEGRTFVFGDSLYGAQDKAIFKITDSGLVMPVATANRPVVLVGADVKRNRVYVSDTNGGEVRMVDVPKRSIGTALLVVGGPVVVIPEPDEDQINVITSNGVSAIRLNIGNRNTSSIPFQGLPTPYGYDAVSNRIYAAAFSDWNVAQLRFAQVKTGTSGLATLLAGDTFEVVVAPPSAPTRVRGVRR
jgi:hypothetical protein